MALLMKEPVANSEQSHEHGRSWKKTGKGRTSLRQHKQQGQFVLHSELNQEQLFPALTTLVCCPPNMGQPALESHLHSAGSLG